MQHGRSKAELQAVHAHTPLAMCRMEQERQKIKGVALNYDYKNEEASFSHDMHNYDKVINMEEFVDVFAQLNTRKLEQKGFSG